MEVKCKFCEDAELLWLYRPRRGEINPEQAIVTTDYAICPECERIYKQWIESRVHWKLMIVQKEES